MKVEKFKVLLYLKKSGPDKSDGKQDNGTVRMQTVLHSRIMEST